jgi:putative transposase
MSVAPGPFNSRRIRPSGNDVNPETEIRMPANFRVARHLTNSSPVDRHAERRDGSGRRIQSSFFSARNFEAVGIKEVHDDIWLVSFMDYDLGYFDLETRVLEPLENPFGPKVLPMS